MITDSDYKVRAKYQEEKQQGYKVLKDMGCGM